MIKIKKTNSMLWSLNLILVMISLILLVMGIIVTTDNGSVISKWAFTNKNGWLFIGLPAIMVGVVFIATYYTHSKIIMAREHLNEENYKMSKASLKSAMTSWILAFTSLISIISFIVVSAFVVKDNGRTGWEIIGVGGDKADIKFSVYIFATILLTVILIIVLVALIRAIVEAIKSVSASESEFIAMKKEEPIVKNKIVEEIVDYINKTQAVPVKQIDVAKPKTKIKYKRIAKHELVDDMYKKINANLTLADVGNYSKVKISNFIDEFGNAIAVALKEGKKVSIHKFSTFETYNTKPTSRINPRNVTEIIEIPSKVKIRANFSKVFKENITKNKIQRDNVIHEKKILSNLSKEKVTSELEHNIKIYSELTVEELKEFAKFANHKGYSTMNKVELVELLKYTPTKYLVQSRNEKRYK